jgi:phosphopantothenoylcysteine decarboxylase/phosphopantothenate--cysteine ligase
MGGARNRVAIVSGDKVEEWPDMTKEEVAARLALVIADKLETIVV